MYELPPPGAVSTVYIPRNTKCNLLALKLNMRRIRLTFCTRNDDGEMEALSTLCIMAGTRLDSGSLRGAGPVALRSRITYHAGVENNRDDSPFSSASQKLYIA